MDKKLCSWYNYKKHCTANEESNGLCKRHLNQMKLYSVLKDSLEPCSTKKVIRLDIRSRKHLLNVLSKLHIEDTTIDVIFPGSCIEEASIIDDEFIELTDESKFYYAPDKKLRRKRIPFKAVLTEYCPNDAFVVFMDKHYCKDCYKTFAEKCFTNSPSLNILEGSLSEDT
jgi:hypothetical protein